MNKNLTRLILSIGLLIAQTASAGWVQSNDPGGNIAVLEVSGDNVFAGTRGDSVFHSDDNGKSWTRIINNKGYFLTLASDTIFEDSGLTVFKSSNNGTNWTLFSTLPMPIAPMGAPHIASLILSGNNYYANFFTYFGLGTGTTNIFVSHDSGKDWIEADSGLSPSDDETELVLSNNNLFACNDAGISLSTNYGRNWKAVDSGLPPNPSCWSLAALGSNLFAGILTNVTSLGGGGIAGKNAGLYRSANNGTSWMAVNTGLPDSSVFHWWGASNVYCFAVSDTVIFAAINNGIGLQGPSSSLTNNVFVSKNNGDSWTNFNSGLPDSIIINKLSANNTYLFAATSAGVWQRPLSEATGINTQKPQQGVSHQENFKIFAPSNTNQFAAIQFSLLHSDQVSVKIFNLSGREIATLVNKNLGAGEHSLSWDTKNVAAGCYAVKMQVGSNVYVKNIPISR